jgi:hypothetical protein
MLKPIDDFKPKIEKLISPEMVNDEVENNICDYYPSSDGLGLFCKYGHYNLVFI